MLSEYFSPVDLLVLKPIILLTLFGLGVLLTDLFLEKEQKSFNAITPPSSGWPSPVIAWAPGRAESSI